MPKLNVGHFISGAAYKPFYLGICLRIDRRWSECRFKPGQSISASSRSDEEGPAAAVAVWSRYLINTRVHRSLGAGLNASSLSDLSRAAQPESVLHAPISDSHDAAKNLQLVTSVCADP